MAITNKGIETKAVVEENDRPTATLVGSELLDQISMHELPFSTTCFLPPYAVIPDSFKFGYTKWNRLFSDWFYSGVKNLLLIPKSGVDVNKATCVIKAHMNSFEPSHGHKEAGVAYMMSLLFEDASWSLYTAEQIEVVGDRE